MAKSRGKVTVCASGRAMVRATAAGWRVGLAGVPVPEVPVTGVVGGVDTHGRTHVAAAVDQLGRLLGTRAFPVSTAGYEALRGWLAGHAHDGRLLAVGVEGTGSYGAGLARALTQAGITVLEVNRPDRAERHRAGKDDDQDAIAAARAVLGGRAAGVAKQRGEAIEAIRVLRMARTSAVKARTVALNQLKDLRVTAPAALRATLEPLKLPKLAAVAAAFQIPHDQTSTLSDPVHATKLAMHRLGRRVAALDNEIAEANTELDTLVAATAPTTLALCGAGTDTVGQLLVTAGANPERLRNDATFARLLGVAPIPASSGNTQRHRLHRGGDRAGNAAIYRITIVRMRHHQPTRDYLARRTTERLTKRMIIRCLKRYIAREVYHALIHDLTSNNTPQPAT